MYSLHRGAPDGAKSATACIMSLCVMFKLILLDFNLGVSILTAKLPNLIQIFRLYTMHHWSFFFFNCLCCSDSHVYRRGYFYWSDVLTDTIYRANMNDTSNPVVLVNTSTDVVGMYICTPPISPQV